MKLTYHCCGDYLRPWGKYGRMHLNYFKKHHSLCLATSYCLTSHADTEDKRKATEASIGDGVTGTIDNAH